jgi:branched-subunit amino acid aminotransferase/4-amino-4-deoxychorismate lyase
MNIYIVIIKPVKWRGLAIVDKSRIEDILFSSNEAYSGEDQVFTTMRVSNHHVYFWDEHVKRVVANLEYLCKWNNITYPKAIIEENIENYLARQVKLKVESSGEWRVRLSFFFKDQKICHYLGIFECEGKFGEHPPHDLTFVKKSKDELRPTLLKSGTYKDTLSLKKDMLEKGFSEIAFIDENDFILEAGTSNIFLLKDEKEVVTPPLRKGVLTGTCRENLIYYFRLNGLTVLEREISKEEIIPNDKNNLVLTNAVWGVQTVRSIEKMKYIKSIFWKEMIHSFHKKMERV